MSDPLHPTNPDWILFDPAVNQPPKEVHLLLVTAGGVLVIGPWHEGCIAWGYKPQLPASVKFSKEK